MNCFWTQEEVEYLINNYENMTNHQLSINMKKSFKSTTSKSQKLGLKKSKSHISKMKSIRNKMVGRDLSYEMLSSISKKYKTRGEFQTMDPSAYSTARVSGILDDICEHMIKLSYSTPQLILKYIMDSLLKSDSLYNTRKIINPYEIDVYYPQFKLAFEYNGKNWHKSDIIDKGKICSDIGILLVNINENNRRYEEDVKNQIVDNLDVINNRCFSNISKSDVYDLPIDLPIIMLLDNDKIIEICSRYTNYSKFKTENVGLYDKLIRLNSIDKYTSHMFKRGGITEESCLKEVSKYIYMSDFLRDSYRYYIWVKKNKKEYLLKNLILKGNKKLKGIQSET